MEQNGQQRKGAKGRKRGCGWHDGLPQKQQGAQAKGATAETAGGRLRTRHKDVTQEKTPSSSEMSEQRQVTPENDNLE
jgi:hypothetical protein